MKSAIARVLLNLGGMIPRRIARVVVRAPRGGVAAALLGHIGHNGGWHGGWMGQNGAYKAHGAQLEGKASARMIALRACKQLMITVRKVKRARQLQGRGCVGIASVAPLLLLREELDRHAAPSAAPCATACSLKGFSIGGGCEQARRCAPPARHDRRGAFSKPMLNVWFSLP